MAKAETRITIDGQEYAPGDEIWDLGGWECTSVDTEGHRTYMGDEVMEKLPPYAPTGSQAIAETGEIYLKYPNGWNE